MAKKKIIPSTDSLDSKISLSMLHNEGITPTVAEQEFALRLELQELIENTKQSTKTQKELTKQLSELTNAIKLISEHEFTQIHRSKWSIFLYQLSLGMLFAIGTVLGLATFSWSVYTFFRDSEILRQIVDKQLNSRNFNFTEIREKAMRDAQDGKTTNSATGTIRSIEKTISGAITGN